MGCNQKAMSITLTGALLLSTFGVAFAAPAQAANVTMPMAIQSQHTLANKQLAEIESLMNLINDYREGYNLPALKFNIQASEEAANWSKVMGNTGRMVHSDTPQWDTGLTSVAFSRSENIAESPHTDVSKMFNQWVTSESHRAAMLSLEMDSVGFGVYYTNSNDPKYSTSKMYGTTVLYKSRTDNMPNSFNSVAEYKSSTSSPLPTTDTSLVAVTPLSPSYNATTKKVTIPNTRGVRYVRSGITESYEAGKTYQLSMQREAIYAVPLEGYKINDSATFIWKYDLVGNVWKEGYEPFSPFLSNISGTEQKLNIPYDDVIDYYVNGVKKAPGNYMYNNGTKLAIEADVKDSQKDFYYLANYSGTWDFLVGATNVSAKKVIFNLKDQTFEIPSVPNVKYLVNGSELPANTYALEPGATYKFSVAPVSNSYVISNQNSFTMSYMRPDIKVTAPTPSFNQQNKTYTIPTVPNGVEYNVDGDIKGKGTHTVVGNRNVTIQVTSNPGYVLEGAKSWVGDFTKTWVTPAAPKFDTNEDTYTIPNTTGVTYFVNNVSKAAGTHGATTRNTTIEARSSSTSYVLLGTTKWTQVFEDVLTAVTPATPTVDNVKGVYNIPATTGVAYYVDGVLKTAGNYPISLNSNVSVVAEALTGYGLQGISAWNLSYTSTSTSVATVAPTAKKVTGEYVLENIAGITWKVDGVVKNPGTYQSGWKKVVITASPSSSKYVLTGTTSWTLDLTKTTITAPAPAFSSTSYTIPNTPGVSYYVDYTFKKPGTYQAYNKLVAIHAAPSAANYQFTGAALWVKDYRISVTPKMPTMNSAKTEIYIPVQSQIIFYGPTGPLAQGKSHKFTGNVSVEAAEANDSYKLSGTQKWNYVFKSFVTPTTPTFNASKNTITIPKRTGVDYYINGVKKTANTYVYNNTGYITITTKSSNTSLYSLTGTQTWKPVLSTIVVKPKAPTWSASKNAIYIPSTTGVTYYINGKAVKAGTNIRSEKGYIKVTTKPSSVAYSLTSTQSWSMVLSTIVVKPKAPTWSTSKKTISVPATTGVTYYINGKATKAGTTKRYEKGYIKVTTKPSSAAYSLASTQSWSIVLTKISVKPKVPTFSTSKNSVKINGTTGVNYYVNGSLKKAGKTYVYKNGTTLKVTTKASNASYGLTGTTSWTKKI